MTSSRRAAAEITAIITKKQPRYRTGALVQVTATVRPRQVDKIPALLDAGVSHFRFNLSHFKASNPSEWRQLAERIWRERTQLGIYAGIMLDTRGPEFRIKLPPEDLTLGPTGTYTLSAEEAPDTPWKENTLYVRMPEALDEFPSAARGREVRIKDGMAEGKITAVSGKELRFTLTRCPNKGIELEKDGGETKLNFPGLDLGLSPLGPDDQRQLEFFIEARPPGETIDYVALSFVKNVGDVEQLRTFLNDRRCRETLIIPKLETRECVEEGVLERIIEHESTAAVMIARGDLANETSRARVPTLQRRIIETAHQYWKPVLLATEVYGSMEDPGEWQSTRPEAEDLRSALDWAVDGVILTGETANRDEPEAVVNLLLEQAGTDEKDMASGAVLDGKREKRRKEFEEMYAALLQTKRGRIRRSSPFPLRDRRDFSSADMAIGAVFRANNRSAEALFALTAGGNTVRDMVHFLPYAAILPFTDQPTTIARLLLHRGVFPIWVESMPQDFSLEDLKQLVQDAMKRFDIGTSGTEAIATMPHPMGLGEGTDTLIRIRRQ